MKAACESSEIEFLIDLQWVFFFPLSQEQHAGDDR